MFNGVLIIILVIILAIVLLLAARFFVGRGVLGAKRPAQSGGVDDTVTRINIDDVNNLDDEIQKMQNVYKYISEGGDPTGLDVLQFLNGIAYKNNGSDNDEAVITACKVIAKATICRNKEYLYKSLSLMINADADVCKALLKYAGGGIDKYADDINAFNKLKDDELLREIKAPLFPSLMKDFYNLDSDSDCSFIVFNAAGGPSNAEMRRLLGKTAKYIAPLIKGEKYTLHNFVKTNVDSVKSPALYKSKEVYGAINNLNNAQVFKDDGDYIVFLSRAISMPKYRESSVLSGIAAYYAVKELFAQIKSPQPFLIDCMAEKPADTHFVWVAAIWLAIDGQNEKIIIIAPPNLFNCKVVKYYREKIKFYVDQIDTNKWAPVFIDSIDTTGIPDPIIGNDKDLNDILSGISNDRDTIVKLWHVLAATLNKPDSTDKVDLDIYAKYLESRPRILALEGKIFVDNYIFHKHAQSGHLWDEYVVNKVDGTGDDYDGGIFAITKQDGYLRHLNKLFYDLGDFDNLRSFVKKENFDAEYYSRHKALRHMNLIHDEDECGLMAFYRKIFTIDFPNAPIFDIDNEDIDGITLLRNLTGKKEFGDADPKHIIKAKEIIEKIRQWAEDKILFDITNLLLIGGSKTPWLRINDDVVKIITQMNANKKAYEEADKVGRAKLYKSLCDNGLDFTKLEHNDVDGTLTFKTSKDDILEIRRASKLALLDKNNTGVSSDDDSGASSLSSSGTLSQPPLFSSAATADSKIARTIDIDDTNINKFADLLDDLHNNKGNSDSDLFEQYGKMIKNSDAILQDAGYTNTFDIYIVDYLRNQNSYIWKEWAQTTNGAYANNIMSLKLYKANAKYLGSFAHNWSDKSTKNIVTGINLLLDDYEYVDDISHVIDQLGGAVPNLDKRCDALKKKATEDAKKLAKNYASISNTFLFRDQLSPITTLDEYADLATNNPTELSHLPNIIQFAENIIPDEMLRYINYKFFETTIYELGKATSPAESDINVINEIKKYNFDFSAVGSDSEDSIIEQIKISGASSTYVNTYSATANKPPIYLIDHDKNLHKKYLYILNMYTNNMILKTNFEKHGCNNIVAGRYYQFMSHPRFANAENDIYQMNAIYKFVNEHKDIFKNIDGANSVVKKIKKLLLLAKITKIEDANKDTELQNLLEGPASAPAPAAPAVPPVAKLLSWEREIGKLKKIKGYHANAIANIIDTNKSTTAPLTTFTFNPPKYVIPNIDGFLKRIESIDNSGLHKVLANIRDNEQDDPKMENYRLKQFWQWPRYVHDLSLVPKSVQYAGTGTDKATLYRLVLSFHDKTYSYANDMRVLDMLNGAKDSTIMGSKRAILSLLAARSMRIAGKDNISRLSEDDVEILARGIIDHFNAYVNAPNKNQICRSTKDLYLAYCHVIRLRGDNLYDESVNIHDVYQINNTGEIKEIGKGRNNISETEQSINMLLADKLPSNFNIKTQWTRVGAHLSELIYGIDVNPTNITIAHESLKQLCEVAKDPIVRNMRIDNINIPNNTSDEEYIQINAVKYIFNKVKECDNIVSLNLPKLIKVDYRVLDSHKSAKHYENLKKVNTLDENVLPDFMRNVFNEGINFLKSRLSDKTYLASTVKEEDINKVDAKITALIDAAKNGGLNDAHTNANYAHLAAIIAKDINDIDSKLTIKDGGSTVAIYEAMKNIKILDPNDNTNTPTNMFADKLPTVAMILAVKAECIDKKYTDEYVKILKSPKMLVDDIEVKIKQLTDDLKAHLLSVGGVCASLPTALAVDDIRAYKKFKKPFNETEYKMLVALFGFGNLFDLTINRCETISTIKAYPLHGVYALCCEYTKKYDKAREDILNTKEKITNNLEAVKTAVDGEDYSTFLNALKLVDRATARGHIENVYDSMFNFDSFMLNEITKLNDLITDELDIINCNDTDYVSEFLKYCHNKGVSVDDAKIAAFTSDTPTDIDMIKNDYEDHITGLSVARDVATVVKTAIDEFNKQHTIYNAAGELLNGTNLGASMAKSADIIKKYIAEIVAEAKKIDNERAKIKANADAKLKELQNIASQFLTDYKTQITNITNAGAEINNAWSKADKDAADKAANESKEADTKAKKIAEEFNSAVDAYDKFVDDNSSYGYPKWDSTTHPKIDIRKDVEITAGAEIREKHAKTMEARNMYDHMEKLSTELLQNWRDYIAAGISVVTLQAEAIKVKSPNKISNGDPVNIEKALKMIEILKLLNVLQNAKAVNDDNIANIPDGATTIVDIKTDYTAKFANVFDAAITEADDANTAYEEINKAHVAAYKTIIDEQKTNLVATIDANIRADFTSALDTFEKLLIDTESIVVMVNTAIGGVVASHEDELKQQKDISKIPTRIIERWVEHDKAHTAYEDAAKIAGSDFTVNYKTLYDNFTVSAGKSKYDSAGEAELTIETAIKNVDAWKIISKIAKNFKSWDDNLDLVENFIVALDNKFKAETEKAVFDAAVASIDRVLKNDPNTFFDHGAHKIVNDLIVKGQAQLKDKIKIVGGDTNYTRCEKILTGLRKRFTNHNIVAKLNNNADALTTYMLKAAGVGLKTEMAKIDTKLTNTQNRLIALHKAIVDQNNHMQQYSKQMEDHDRAIVEAMHAMNIAQSAEEARRLLEEEENERAYFEESRAREERERREREEAEYYSSESYSRQLEEQFNQDIATAIELSLRFEAPEEEVRAEAIICESIAEITGDSSFSVASKLADGIENAEAISAELQEKIATFLISQGIALPPSANKKEIFHAIGEYSKKTGKRLITKSSLDDLSNAMLSYKSTRTGSWQRRSAKK